MPTASLPPTEISRLVAVQRLRMIGTPAEERFDKITRLAKRRFNVPSAIIDIIGEKRVWMKSVQGLDAFAAPRETSFCQFAILSSDVCLIPDTPEGSKTNLGCEPDRSTVESPQCIGPMLANAFWRAPLTDSKIALRRPDERA